MKKGFTLIELLVVVLIIGILAAIALPQYRRVVMKANVHKGIPLVASLFEAEQLYYMLNGEYTSDLDLLDAEIPIDSSCEKWQSGTISGWDCSWGGLEVAQDVVSFVYPVHTPPTSYVAIVYGHLLKNEIALQGRFRGYSRYCLARPNNSVAQAVCEDMGGVLVDSNGTWKYYGLP